MIQRIQSVYLLLSSLFFTFFLLFPVFKMQTASGIVAEKATENIWLLVIDAVLILGSLAVVFLYKNRVLQKNIVWLLVLLNVLLVALLGYHYYLISKSTTVVSLGFAVIFPVITIILLLLAIYNINKDEKLVRSLDRLR